MAERAGDGGGGFEATSGISPPELLQLVPRRATPGCYQCVPVADLGFADNALQVAMADPLNPAAIDELEDLRFSIGKEIQPVVAPIRCRSERSSPRSITARTMRTSLDSMSSQELGGDEDLVKEAAEAGCGGQHGHRTGRGTPTTRRSCGS